MKIKNVITSETLPAWPTYGKQSDIQQDCWTRTLSDKHYECLPGISLHTVLTVTLFERKQASRMIAGHSFKY
jgi:hypothetical protein